MFWSCNGGGFKNLVELLKDLLVQVWFEFRDNEVKILNVDPHKMASIHFSLFPSPDEYKGSTPTPWVFCCFTTELHKALRGVKKNDTISLYREDQQEELHIQTTTGLKIKIKCLPDVLPVFNFIHRDYKVSFDMQTKELYDLLHDLVGISRKVVIEKHGTIITWTSENDNGLSTSCSMDREDLAGNNHEVTSQFFITYMEKFAKIAYQGTIRVHLTQHAPLRLEYILPNGFLRLNLALSV